MKTLLFVVMLVGLCISTTYAQEATPAGQQMTAPQSGDFDHAMKLYKQRRYNEAIAEFESIVSADPKNAAAYYMMGYAHYVMKHKPEALAAFGKAFAADPNFDPRPYFRR